MRPLISIKNLWKRLSVSHKLYAVVGVMALLIATELFTLIFAMNTLSAVRAFVGGEGIWSKAQKDSILEIQNYARTHDEKYYLAFQQHLLIPMGDHQARMELQKPDMDHALVTAGFLQGQIHPKDIDPMVNLMRRFYKIKYIERAIGIWGEGDNLISHITEISEQLHDVIASSKGNPDQKHVDHLLAQIFETNDKLTDIENQFSSTLGAASRWLERLLTILLVIAVATVESTGLLLTVIFSRSLTRVLNELHEFAAKVGEGDFSKTVPVRSSDELGRLANALNKMTLGLRETTIERRDADRANQIKSLFLANMSHEIRTPLSAILGFVDLLKEPTLSVEERQKYLEIIERTGFGLATIINDILDISKVEAGKLEITKSISSLSQLLIDLKSLLGIRCEEKGISLEFINRGLPEYALMDSTRLKQILLNVIGNAIKFTNQGKVTATFETKGSHLICTITDTGVGIAAESVDKLFQPFSQIDLSIRKEFGGTGLGLILSKRLAKLMNGDVTLKQSAPGKGSTFEVSVLLEYPQKQPMTAAKQDPSGVPRSPLLKGKKILVVEDSLDNQLLAQTYLSREGAVVDTASNGLKALEKTFDDNFDLILMDMQMPVMDGYTATSQMRQKGVRTPIVALTAHAMKEDLDKCINAGCNDYLSKPFRRSHLISMVERYCEISTDLPTLEV